MKATARFLCTLAALSACVPSAVYAHFRLLEPASWLVEDQRGDPQKAGPCGGDGKGPGTPSNTIGKVVGGSKLHLKVEETVFHPGHNRVALAVNSRDAPLPSTVVKATASRETENAGPP